MGWIIFLAASALCLLGSIVFAVIWSRIKCKNSQWLNSSKILFVGVVVSSIVLFIPIYWDIFKTNECGIFETILIAIHNMIRLFIVDGEFEFITSNLGGVPSTLLFKGYTILFSILFVLAPILTFSFVLSFFKSISAYRCYIMHYNSDIFVFSELNEKSLALAKNLHKNNAKDRFFIFTDVFEREEEKSYELIEKSKEIGAVCFKKDIITMDFLAHSKKSALYFFTIGIDQSENISQTLRIIDKFKNRENTNIYVFATQIESELLLVNAFHNAEEAAKIKVRRIDEVQALIMRNLYEKGFEKIFSSAWPDVGGNKKIGAVIIGMGQYGTEMTKALSWFCQMDGYQVEINSFERDKNAEPRFTSECPELMKFSGKWSIKGEARYNISIHSGVDVDTIEFDNMIGALPKTTYVFVALGSDEKNISVAVKLRAMFERMHCHPEIQAVLYNSDKKEALTNITNFRGQEYDIDFIGDVNSSYSEEVIFNSKVEDRALKRHLKWGEEKDFWQYNYNYKSSVASAIHYKMKILCKIPGIEKEPEKRTQEELWGLRILEHRRWNTYMRAEGYVYGGTIEKYGRNDLAKTHNCLVPFAELPLEEQEKDDN